MTTTIYLVRHGQTNSNVTGYYMGRSEEDLNDTGYAQVHRLSAKMESFSIDAVYSSPLLRTQTTAGIIAEPHNITLKMLEELTEIDLGEWQGKHLDEIRKNWPDMWQQTRIDPSDVEFPGGESFRQAAERAIKAFRIVADTILNQTSVIVTHDIIVRTIISHVLGVPNSIYRRIEINNASLSTVEIDGDKMRLINLNDTSHLN